MRRVVSAAFAVGVMLSSTIAVSTVTIAASVPAPSSTATVDTALTGSQTDVAKAAPIGLSISAATEISLGAATGSPSASVSNGTGATAALRADEQAGIGLGGSGNTPYFSAYDSITGQLFVSDFATGKVAVINGASDQWVKNVGVGTDPTQLTFDPRIGYVYVPNTGSGNITIINGATDKTVGSITNDSDEPHSILFDSVNGLLYSPNDGGKVDVIKGLEKIRSIKAGTDPLNAVLDPQNGYLYVTNQGSNNVSVIDTATNKTVAKIGVGSAPNFLAYDSSNSFVYVANVDSNNVTIIKTGTNRVSGSIPAGSEPMGVTYDPANRLIYVCNSGSAQGANTVTAINGTTSNSPRTTIYVGVGPKFAVYDPATQWLYVANDAGNNVTVENGSGHSVAPFLIGLVATGTFPRGLTYDAGNGEVYTANQASNSISAIETATSEMVATSTVGEGAGYSATGFPYVGGENVSMDPSTGNLYITSYASDSISVLNAMTYATISTLLPSGQTNPNAVILDSSNGCMYVSMATSVVPICGTQIERGISVNSQAESLLFDPSNGYIYAPGPTQGGHVCVEVINGTTDEVVKCVGLPITYREDGAGGMVLDPVDGLLYVSNGVGELNVIRTSTDDLVKNISAFAAPPGYDPATDEVYVGGGDHLDIFDAATFGLTANLTLPLWGCNHQPLYDSEDGDMYIPCGGEGRASAAGLVAVGSSNVVLGHVPTGSKTAEPFAILNPSNGFVYASAGASNLSVINGTVAVGWLNVGPDPGAGIYDPLSGAEVIPVQVTQGPFGSPGYVGLVGMLGPIPDAGSIESASVKLVNGFQEAFVNWTDPTEQAATFQWGSTREYGLKIPRLEGLSVDLNSLTEGTLYYYRIVDTASNGQTHWTSGTFTTVDAPADELVGWIYAMTANPHAVIQSGAPIAGATIDSIWSPCINPDGKPVTIPFPSDPKTGAPLPAATSDSAGAYSLSFPIPYSAFDYNYYYLYQNGTCRDNTYQGSYGGSWVGSVAHPVSVNASVSKGRWNATQYLGQNSASQGMYAQYSLPANDYNYSLASAAWVHTSYASCGVTIAAGVSQSVQALNGGRGHIDNSSWVNVTSANPVSNNVSAVDFHYSTTGTVNETNPLSPKILNAYAFGKMKNPSGNAVFPKDPYGTTPPNGSQIYTFGQTGGSESWTDGGSYTSVRGLDIAVGLGGYGVSATANLVYTTSEGTSGSKEVLCSFSDPEAPAGLNAQFYVYLDPTGVNDAAIMAHVWFDDFCVPNASTCS